MAAGGQDHRHARPAASAEHHPSEHHHVLIEPQEDRWEWRRRIRRSPRKLVVYRFLVALLGGLLILTGCVSGPLPGPGGIPLVLLGLAVWSSEFEWAHRLMQWFKRQLHRVRGWSRRRKAALIAACVVAALTAAYCYLSVLGVPGWLPDGLADLAYGVPGLR